MVISLDELSDIPIYQQIRDQIVIGISEGGLQPGEQLPTVRNLANEIGINVMTVNKAYQLLKQQGYIITDRRNGARVRTRIQRAELGRDSVAMLRRVISEAKLSGMGREAFLKLCEEYYGEERSEWF